MQSRGRLHGPPSRRRTRTKSAVSLLKCSPGGVRWTRSLGPVRLPPVDLRSAVLDLVELQNHLLEVPTPVSVFPRVVARGHPDLPPLLLEEGQLVVYSGPGLR